MFQNKTLLGAILGVLVAFAILSGHVLLLLILAVAGGIGALIGAHCDGKINLYKIFHDLIENVRRGGRG
ncbi:hypothetical protein [Corynebacterium pseudotuberculosis]|uniref:hypothetical protein n=1 Tax=Corynebacterium pseudotuberculosis TaxID=1719 RepID=UPI0002660578|nr:hypothetical protein [Corynebacterium pseudotuberculosis]AFM06708.1 hypothetical protein CP162_01850 [Corynebacterium pseudotuberculosis Cp162]APG81063.1 Hypothetical protein CPI37_0371 [Corynebacterium pseudotuberculosis]WFP67536.1 hypothetical protein P8128_01835 [Corynebacterium pseudotuberculosis]